MWAKHKQDSGFTIVELLIVIVVIAILAAISVVAYNGIQNRAKASSLSSSLNQAAKKISLWQIDNSGATPTSLSLVGVSDNGATTYTYDQTDSGKGYCLIATNGGVSYNISSSTSSPQQGVCSGSNILSWVKGDPNSPMPVPSSVMDTSVYRTSVASMKFAPNTAGQPLRNNPHTGDPGQVYTVSFWIITDPTWNGAANNSKIRFANAGGTQIANCPYNGVKTSWTYITCSFTLSSTNPQVNISIGNDGTTGNIWIDDFSLTKT